MKRFAHPISTLLLFFLLLLELHPANAAPEADLLITARTAAGIASDWTAVYYSASSSPVLLGNDKGAASGGLRAFSLTASADTAENGTLAQLAHQTPGRTSVLTTVYDVNEGGRDLVLSIAAPDSVVRLYDAGSLDLVDGDLGTVLGAWSALCAWRSPRSGEQYVYLFGKGRGVQFLLRADGWGTFEILEVKTFDTPVEASSCAVSANEGSVYFGGDDDSNVYHFAARESTAVPEINVLGEASGDVTGLAVYVGAAADYLLIAQTDVVEVYDTDLNLLGTLTLTGDEDIEIQGLSIYQSSTESYPAGALAYALESDAGEGFGVSSLDSAFEALNLTLNTAYDPRRKSCKLDSPISETCNKSGFDQDGICSCFAGFVGNNCENLSCQKDCSGRGTCVGANRCECEVGWGGLHCSFMVVDATEETDAFGGDGDDPAIWIHPTDKSQSKIITTIKSDEGAGLAVFYLNGTTAQTFSAGEPDNVDIIYGFQAGDRKVDLAFAACRDDNTLCIFEITADGTLADIAGGSQPTKDDYDVYGSCVYHSRRSGKQYLFVNAKTAEYLQYELNWVDNALQTSLVRNFTGGSGGQVEGCVTDEANGWILIGEEPRALWRYGAEPEDDVSEGYLVDQVGSGHMWADVEGVTLVEGPSAGQGFILVSQQGVSAYNVYQRAAPHDFVLTFTIGANEGKGIDAVSNTDGITAVGASLGEDFPYGIFVTHDDANELVDGGTSEQASFKIVSLTDIFSEGLLRDIDPDWDPRST
ncbi:hypothetical protein TruAng_000683 [Truncatella angustata]|nr:hypothetical protein TruAng_000683 [Truncatella angustata]